MAEVGPCAVIFRFGVFEADVDAGELRKNGVKLKLQEQPFQVLTMLLERAGVLVTREELRDRVWPQDTFVDFDHAVNTAITKIRLALADDADNPRFVETIPRRGYRFIAPVEGNHISRSAHLPAQENIDLDVRAETRRHQRRVFLWIAVPLVLLLAAGVYVAKRTGKVSRPSFQRLTFDRGTIYNARFTPDGQMIVYGAAWDGKPFQMFWTRPGAYTSSPFGPANADVLAISAKGEVAALLNPHVRGFNMRTGTLILLPLSGGTPQEILENVQDADFSADGERMAVVHWVGDKCRLEFPIGKALYETTEWISYPRISPLGDHIAFLDHPLEGDDGGSIAVIDLAGRKTTLSKIWMGEAGVSWANDGKQIWFAADGLSEDGGIYAVTLSGKLHLVSANPGFTLGDLSRDGRMLAIHHNLSGGTMALVPGETRERDLTWLASSACKDISRDGRTFLMDVIATQKAFISELYIRRIDASSPVRIGDGFAQALSPDGKWALSLVDESPQKLVVLPTGPREAKVLPQGPIEHYQGGAKWLSDSRRILFVGREKGHALRVYLQDMDAGGPRAITPEAYFGYNPWPVFAVSPDDNYVAVPLGNEQKVLAYPINGGEPRAIPGLLPGEVPVVWSADGRSLFVTRQFIAPAKIYAVNVQTGERRPWKTFMLYDPAGVTKVDAVLRPNARSYCYSYDRDLSDLYVVDGVK